MIADIKKTAEQKMEKSVETLKTDLGKVRTGRAHTGLLDHIRVDYYGTPMPLSQVANLTLADARTIDVQPWEKKMVPVIEKAIRDSDLGLNPATLGRPDPRADAGADRGAPPRPDQGRPARGRERAHRGAQHPPRRQRAPEEAAEGQGGCRGRRAPRAGRRAEAHRPLHRRDRQAPARRRKPT